MADEQKNNSTLVVGGLAVAAIISALVGSFFVSGNQSSKNQQDDIDSIAAIREQVLVLREELTRVRSATLSPREIEASLSGFSERINAIEGQITRRFSEVVQQPLDLIRIDTEKNEDIILDIVERLAGIESRIDAIEDFH